MKTLVKDLQDPRNSDFLEVLVSYAIECGCCPANSTLNKYAPGCDNYSCPECWEEALSGRARDMRIGWLRSRGGE